MSMHAHSVSRGGSNSLFSATAGNPHPMNMMYYSRGGIRL